MIHYHIENGKPSWCPSCGDPLPKINDDIKKFLLSFIRVRSSKYPVDKDLICSGRINFRQQLKVDMPSKKDEHGKWLHRRHIIPQHLLRNAWNVAVRKHKPDDKELKKMLDKLGGSGKFDNSQPLASAILYTLNENKNNLFLDDGTANSAIGAFAHSLCDLVEKHTRLQSSKPDIIKEFKEIKTPPLWGKDVKNKVKDDIATYTLLLKQQSTAGEVLELLEDLADTANLDLDTAQGLKSQNRNAIRLYGKFGDWVKTPGSWEEFIELACDFMNTKMTDAS